MPSSDALVVANEWISEFYFTADETKGTFLAAVKSLIKDWAQESADAAEYRSPLARFTESRQQILSELISLHAEAAEIPVGAGPDHRRAAVGRESSAMADHLRRVLGYETAPHRGGGALRWYTPMDTPEPCIAVIDALAAETAEELLSKEHGLLAEIVMLEDDGQSLSSVSELLSALISEDHPPRYMLVLAGRTVVLTSEDAWPQGRYLAVDLQTVAERGEMKSGGEVQRMLACLSAPSVTPDAQGVIWWDARREESVRNAVGVSQDLREGVRESIEIIANEVVARRKAQGLEPLPDDQAQSLAVQSLRYLYRILFLLYAEASPELGVVPAGDPEYQAGYSLDRLRELTLQDLTSRSARGTHFYASLRVLFELVDAGHRSQAPDTGEDEQGAREGLAFEALRSDLFRRDRTALIDEVRLGNEALQRVLRNLLLTRERKGRSRGFISYVALGINQLGAVYETLMSYTGSFASETLVEVAKRGDPSEGSWVIPEARVDEALQPHVVMVEDDLGRQVPRTYHYGEFVFRLSGRQRQQSASYYSPKVLTEFTVQQGLEELLTEEMTAEQILGLTVCEPALGSGAFAIEAVRQLAAAYLERRQEELGERIDPEEYPRELQRVKAYIALHNVYGVDLNPTAVELAEVSLWLDTMSRGLQAPWFGLRLRSGNSLVGARHAIHPVFMKKGSRSWGMMETQHHLPLDGTGENTQGIFHFLLPGTAWGAAGDEKEIKKIAPDQAKALREWAKRVRRKPTQAQLRELVSLSERIEELWRLAQRRMVEAERQSRRSIRVWGAEVDPGGSVTREEIEAWRDDPNSAYRRLRLIMDAWCALWFWPVTVERETPEPPEFEEWLTVVRRLIGQTFAGRKGRQEEHFASSADEWETLEHTETMFSVEGAESVEKLLEEIPWLREAQRIAKEQRFFHWELDFAAVFSRGGFDFQVGNPPWVRPRPDVAALLGESDPWWALMEKPSEKAKKGRRERTLALPGAQEILLTGLTDTAALAQMLKSVADYPELARTQPDLYRAFMAQAWRHASTRGHTALIHPPTHLNDAQAYALRKATYPRLRRHWGFINELQLFPEVHDLVSYSVNIYGPARKPLFLNSVSNYHPSTVRGSLEHNGDGPEPGFKNEQGKWELKPHASRITRVNREVLTTWHTLMEGESSDTPVESTRMVFSLNRSSAASLERLADLPQLRKWSPYFTRGWDETGGRRDGYFSSRWGRVSSWDEVILQGPYFHVGNPFYASRNVTMKGNQDYTRVDLETLPEDALPVTEYKPHLEPFTDDQGEMRSYALDYPEGQARDPEAPWETLNAPVRDQYQVIWRKMAANTGERTLIPAIYPPGTGTVNSAFSEAYLGAPQEVVLAAASMSSLIADFLVRMTVGNNIYQSAVDRLPLIPLDHPLAPAAALRILRLNCLTEAYAKLWQDCWSEAMTRDAWTGGRERADRPALGDVTEQWTSATPMRRDEDRRRALVEIDAIVAHVTGIPIEELCTLYRTQFGVLFTYERGEDKRGRVYDAAGRLLPSTVRTAWNQAGRPEEGLSFEDRTYTTPEGRQITAPEPFRILDREQDLREAYAVFAERVEQGVHQPGGYRDGDES